MSLLSQRDQASGRHLTTYDILNLNTRLSASSKYLLNLYICTYVYIINPYDFIFNKFSLNVL